ncbi:MAG: hypothetical protein JEZ12_10890 [Desulfobacterium sp.]|nr:hypothetical protein [Desulfobacterium sp.]
MKLKVKFLFPVLFGILAALLAITALGYVSSRNALEESVNAQLSIFTEATSEVLSKFIRDNRNLVSYLGENPIYGEGAADKDPFRIKAIQQKFPRITKTFSHL